MLDIGEIHSESRNGVFLDLRRKPLISQRKKLVRINVEDARFDGHQRSLRVDLFTDTEESHVCLSTVHGCTDQTCRVPRDEILLAPED